MAAYLTGTVPWTGAEGRGWSLAGALAIHVTTPRACPGVAGRWMEFPHPTPAVAKLVFSEACFKVFFR